MEVVGTLWKVIADDGVGYNPVYWRFTGDWLDGFDPLGMQPNSLHTDKAIDIRYHMGRELRFRGYTDRVRGALYRYDRFALNIRLRRP